MDNSTCWHTHPEYVELANTTDDTDKYREITEDYTPIIQCMFDADEDGCVRTAGLETNDWTLE